MGSAASLVAITGGDVYHCHECRENFHWEPRPGDSAHCTFCGSDFVEQISHGRGDPGDDGAAAEGERGGEGQSHITI